MSQRHGAEAFPKHNNDFTKLEFPMTTASDNLSAIDKALNAAKNKKALKNGEAPVAASAGEGAAPVSTKRPKLSDEDKKARDEKRAAERAEAKAKRDAEREQKRAAKAANAKPAHMSKVDKAAAKLPAMNDDAKTEFDRITCNFSASQIAAIAEHLQHFNRTKATERALTQKLTEGSVVVSGDPKYVGKSGTVSKAQRIRCYVEIAGIAKPVYLYTSDVEVTKAAPAKAAANG